MPKVLKNNSNKRHHMYDHHIHRNKRSGTAQSSKLIVKAKSTNKQAHSQYQSTKVPFDVHDNILLVGEGNLSFTLSLLHDHGCASLTATTFDSEMTLEDKYPHAKNAIQQIRDEDQVYLHNIDAQKLSSNKALKQRAPFDRIFFNFPHTGGISKDVNRQVRANQALLSAFFRSAIPLLSEASGTILVTLFESEPYTLWNIRDIARHAGLNVLRSWKFEKQTYPLYKHARTFGTVKDKTGNVSETAWKGEERPARTYELGNAAASDSAVAESRGRKSTIDAEASDTD